MRDRQDTYPKIGGRVYSFVRPRQGCLDAERPISGFFKEANGLRYCPALHGVTVGNI